jgi:hypothetical protein
MTPSIWLLLILLPFWIALVFFSMKRSFNMAALAAAPALALIVLVAALPLGDDLRLQRMALLRMAGVYMLLIGLLSAIGLMARYGVQARRALPPPSEARPQDGQNPANQDPTTPNA